MAYRPARLALLFAALALEAAAASLVEESPLRDYFSRKFPDIAITQYVHGALAFNLDAMDQYQSIMAAPPFLADLEKAERIWNTPFKNGKRYADCLPKGGRGLAGQYPKFDGALGRVVILEEVVNACRSAQGEPPFVLGDPNTMGLLMAHLRSLSDGAKMDIRVEGAKAMEAYLDGKATFFRRSGQLNFSCAHCHVHHAGERLRSEILSPAVGQATHWPVFRGGERLVTLQNRYQECHRMMRQVPDEIGSPRYNNLEYYHSTLSNGLALTANVFRK